MKKILILIIVLLIVAAGIYFSNQSESNPINPGSENSAGQETVEVIYTDSGYSPDLVRIPVGTTVIFKNESTRLMWTASDVHPTHEIMPEFDPRRGMRGGESYSFKFEKPGTWKYHNHLRAADEGQVIVEQ